MNNLIKENKFNDLPKLKEHSEWKFPRRVQQRCEQSQLLVSQSSQQAPLHHQTNKQDIWRSKASQWQGGRSEIHEMMKHSWSVYKYCLWSYTNTCPYTLDSSFTIKDAWNLNQNISHVYMMCTSISMSLL